MPKCTAVPFKSYAYAESTLQVQQPFGVLNSWHLRDLCRSRSAMLQGVAGREQESDLELVHSIVRGKGNKYTYNIVKTSIKNSEYSRSLTTNMSAGDTNVQTTLQCLEICGIAVLATVQASDTSNTPSSSAFYLCPSPRSSLNIREMSHPDSLDRHLH